jgi:hypothetical protein
MKIRSRCIRELNCHKVWRISKVRSDVATPLLPGSLGLPDAVDIDIVPRLVGYRALKYWSNPFTPLEHPSSEKVQSTSKGI